MSIVWEQEWDKIYREQGEVQHEVLPTVIIASEIYKKHNCSKVMDLGCGTGRHTIYLANKGFHVYATDVSEKGLDITKSKVINLALENVEFKQHDMRDIPFESNFLDAILCVWTTGHGKLSDAISNVNEMYRVLKPNGIVVIDYISTEDAHYGKGQLIEKDTFLNNMEGEESIPHHYSSREEIEDLYHEFSHVDIKPIFYYFLDNYGNKHEIKAFVVVAVK
jgi:ubiquinone/menaquinone biosynthesis C-methylase UbiE